MEGSSSTTRMRGVVVAALTDRIVTAIPERALRDSGRVAGVEERGERPGDGGDDADGPQLEDDVDDPPAARDRVLQGAGDGEQLHRREVERVGIPVDVRVLRVPLEDEHEEGQREVEQRG